MRIHDSKYTFDIAVDWTKLW